MVALVVGVQAVKAHPITVTVKVRALGEKASEDIDNAGRAVRLCHLLDQRWHHSVDDRPTTGLCEDGVVHRRRDHEVNPWVRAQLLERVHQRSVVVGEPLPVLAPLAWSGIVGCELHHHDVGVECQGSLVLVCGHVRQAAAFLQCHGAVVPEVAHVEAGAKLLLQHTRVALAGVGCEEAVGDAGTHARDAHWLDVRVQHRRFLRGPAGAQGDAARGGRAPQRSYGH
eukprot:CAMPEP_0195101406 /NCGR_PEP_ID=MMETSP0448-20130528/65091_1 /TAXON_ID=66468 /ORGANISM="Heterocapsa triquestra, Strain CCMP 448" /LENGTH=225 /DNA_ID=CAMNT_0040136707 /DNA_START=58 /DNA_END=732 /DNA_ORIENTATION=+